MRSRYLATAALRVAAVLAVILRYSRPDGDRHPGVRRNFSSGLLDADLLDEAKDNGLGDVVERSFVFFLEAFA
jgi:hypothetical protein